MKRRGFLGLLGLAPAVPLIAKEMAKPVPMPTAPQPESIASEVAAQPTVCFEKYVDTSCMVTAGHYVSAPSEYDAPHCPDHADDKDCYRCETCHRWHCSLGPHAHSPQEFVDTGLASASFTDGSPFEISWGSPQDWEKWEKR